MQNIPLTIEGTTYEMRPFVYGLNGDISYRTYDYDLSDPDLPVRLFATYDPYYHFSDYYDRGDMLSLYKLFHEKYIECYQAGQAVQSEPYKMVDMVYTVNGVEQDVSLFYDYSYNPANNNILNVTIHGCNVYMYNGELVIRNIPLTYQIDYEQPETIFNTIMCASVRLYNCPKDTYGHVLQDWTEYENSETLYVACPAAVGNVLLHEWYNPLAIWDKELIWDRLASYDAQNSDVAGNEVITLKDAQGRVGYIMKYDHHGYANYSWIPQENGPVGGLNHGYTMLNTHDVDSITINSVPWADDETTSQDDILPDLPFKPSWFNETSDYIPSDGVPVNDPLEAGFVHAYLIGTGSLTQLANYLLSDDFLQNVKNLFQNPIDYILSLVSIPVTPTDVTANQDVEIGGVNTNIKAAKINKSFVEVKFGGIKCEELWHGFIDYAPITKVSLYAPFVGIQELNTDDVMDGELELSYRIDVLTGTFNCSLLVKNSRKTNGILYAYEGTVGYQIPIFASDVTNKLNALKNSVAGGLSAVASGGVIGGATAVMSIIEASISKPNVRRSGSLSGDSGFLGNYTPYIIIERPVQALPGLYAAQKGYASRSSGKISDFSGFLQVDTIDLSGIACTEAEKDLILQAFKEGCFV